MSLAVRSIWEGVAFLRSTWPVWRKPINCSPKRTGTAVSTNPNWQVTVAGFKPGAFRKLLLHLQAGRARPALFRQHGAQGILVALAVVRQLPRFHRAQRDGQAGGFAERLLVILKDLRVNQALDQALVVVAVHLLLPVGLHKICYHVSKLTPPRPAHNQASCQTCNGRFN